MTATVIVGDNIQKARLLVKSGGVGLYPCGIYVESLSRCTLGNDHLQLVDNIP